MNWAERVKQNALEAHLARWGLWQDFLTKFDEKGYMRAYDLREGEKPFETAVIREAGLRNIEVFKTCTLLKDGEAWHVFDAGFGSMNKTSDLDVSVTSRGVDALQCWIEWIATKQFCMSKEWDTNFYYEKGTESGELVPWTQRHFEEALQDTATVEDILRYTEAYRQNMALQIDGFTVYPNPASMTKETELAQYKAILHFARADERKKLQMCKPEGLIHVASLGIVGVYGETLQKELIAHPREWRTLVALEMLCNLRMHAKDGKFKTKYLTRLNNALKNSVNACARHRSARENAVQSLTRERERGGLMLELLSCTETGMSRLAVAVLRRCCSRLAETAAP